MLLRGTLCCSLHLPSLCRTCNARQWDCMFRARCRDWPLPRCTRAHRHYRSSRSGNGMCRSSDCTFLVLLVHCTDELSLHKNDNNSDNSYIYTVDIGGWIKNSFSFRGPTMQSSVPLAVPFEETTTNTVSVVLVSKHTSGAYSSTRVSIITGLAIALPIPPACSISAV